MAGGVLTAAAAAAATVAALEEAAAAPVEAEGGDDATGGGEASAWVVVVERAARGCGCGDSGVARCTTNSADSSSGRSMLRGDESILCTHSTAPRCHCSGLSLMSRAQSSGRDDTAREKHNDGQIGHNRQCDSHTHRAVWQDCQQ